MSYNPYGGKYTYGGSLKHYRTSIANGGSPNGVRKDGSNPIGKRAVGRRLPDGTYVYDNTAMRSAMRNARTDRENASSNTLREGRGMRSTMRNARTDRENASSNTLREGRGMRSAMRNARTDRENASSNTARDARNKYNNSLIGRLDNATKGVRSAVGDWFNKRRAELKTTGKSVGNWLSDRGRDIGRAAKSAYEAVSNSDERRALERAKANYEKDKSAASKYRYDQAKKAYDSHLLTRLGRGAKSAVDTVGDTARNAAGTVRRGAEAAGRAISNQDELDAYKKALAREKSNPTAENKRATREARDAYNRHAITKASGAVRQAGRNVSRAANSAGEFISTTARNAADTVGRGAGTVRRAAGRAWDGKVGKGTGADTANELRKKGLNKAADEYQNSYDQSIVGTTNRLAGQLMSQVKGLPANAQKMYENSIGRIIDNKNISPEQKEAQLNNLAGEIKRSTKKNTKAKNSRAN